MMLGTLFRDGAYFIECKGDELPQGALPAQCRPGSNLNPLPWPPK